MDVACIGLMVCDIIIGPVDKTVFDVDSTRLGALTVASGGDALNTAINLAKLGLKVGMVGKVGNDIFGGYLIGQANHHGVDTYAVKKAERCATATSIVMVDQTGERHFAYYGEANDNLQLHDVDFDRIKDAKIVHLGSAMALQGLDGPGVAELFKRIKASGAVTSMDVTWDSAGKWLEKIEDALFYTDIFMPSYNEARIISGKETPQEMEEFFKPYGIKILVIKLGAQGCFVTDFITGRRINTYQNVKAIDTTGAGDAFVAGFLTGITKKWDIFQCGLFGNAVASNCVMAVGATTGIKSMGHILKFMEEH